MPSSHLAPLTSLRFVAAAAIVLLHSSNYWDWAAWLAPLPLEQGVSFFFVLSGFILTHVYRQREMRLAGFLWARVARLWPTHLFTLGLVLLFIRPDSQQLPGTGFFDPLLALLANTLLLHGLVPFQLYVFSWNSVSWSISTEMGFYLAFPWLLTSLRTTWHWKLAGCFALVWIYEAVRWSLDLPMRAAPNELSGTFLAYSSPVFRLFEFVLGMSAYQLSDRWRRRAMKVWSETTWEAATLLGVVTWYAIFTSSAAARSLPGLPPMVQYWVGTAGSCVVFAAAITVFSRGHGLLGQALSHRGLVWLGQISFALYMVHQVVMKWIAIAQLEGRLPPQGPLAVALACLVAAALLHHLVELPAQAMLLRVGWGGPVRPASYDGDAPPDTRPDDTAGARVAARDSYLDALHRKRREPPSPP